jgi:NAD(P)-dependent dehydrogenase (short-subunit alcohol dehydrogenase family)
MLAHVEAVDLDRSASPLLHGKVAIVTGGAGTVGGAVVARLAAEGVRVLAVDERRAPDPAPVGVDYLRGDVTHPATAPRAVATAEAAYGRLDLLVNAASWSHRSELLGMDLTGWSRALAVNLTGSLLACKAAVPAMVRCGGGAIVNLGAVHPPAGPEQLAYAVSKDAVVALTARLAPALAPLGIRVNCVHPGAGDHGGSPDKEVSTAVLRLLSPAAARRGGDAVAADGAMHGLVPPRDQTPR